MKSAIIIGLATLALSGLSSAADIGCFVPGSCEGTYTNVEVMEDEGACLNFCKGLTGCFYWTYYTNTQACRTHATCTSLSQDCNDCLSGDKSCDEVQCDTVGQCKGTFAGFDTTGTRDLCVQFCKDTEDCAWWSWDSVTQFCTLSETCDVLDTSLTDSISGQQSCPVNEVPEPETDLTLLLITGGYDPDEGRHSDGELLDFSDAGATCSPVANFPYPIEEHTGFNLNGVAHVCGGFGKDTASSEPSATTMFDACYTYDGVANDWVEGPTMDQERARAASIVWDDGTVWVTGGRSKDRVVLDTTSVLGTNGLFTDGPTLPADMEFHCMVKISETIVVIAGGYNYQNSHSRDAYYYNSQSGNYTVLPDMNDGRYGHVCELVRSQSRGAEVVVAGGGLDRTSVDVLDLSSLTWREGTPLPAATAWAKSVPLGDTFLMMGGGDSSGNYFDTIYEYEAEPQTWKLRTEKMDHGKYDFSAIMMDQADLTCSSSPPPPKV